MDEPQPPRDLQPLPWYRGARLRGVLLLLICAPMLYVAINELMAYQHGANITYGRTHKVEGLAAAAFHLAWALAMAYGLGVGLYELFTGRHWR